MMKSEKSSYRLIITMAVLISGAFVLVGNTGFASASDGETVTNLDIDLKLKQLNDCHDDTECVNNSETLIESQSHPGQINVDLDSDTKQKNKCHDDTECVNNSEDKVTAENVPI